MIFISYAREDRAYAERAADAIRERLGLEVWFDQRLRAGSEFAAEIQQALDRALAVVVLWSRDSVKSAYVQDEAARALDARKLLPVRIDDVAPPLGFGRLHMLSLLRTGATAADWDARALTDELIGWVPREIDLPGVLRLDAAQSAELELAQRLMKQRRVTLVCARNESIEGLLLSTGLNLLGLRCSSEDEPGEASGAEMLPRLQAIGESDLCVVLLFPTALGQWYFEACRNAADGRMAYLVFGSMDLAQARRTFPYLAAEPDEAFLTGRPLGVPLSGPGLAKTWETLRFLTHRLLALPPRRP